MFSFLFRLILLAALPNLSGCTNSPTPSLEVENQINQDTTSKSIVIAAVGDCMIGTNYPNNTYLPPYNGDSIFAEATPFLQEADLAFGNCEGVFLTGEGPAKKCSDPSKCFAFKMPDHFVNHFVHAGFDLLSVANNHVGDFGDVGRSNTQKVLSNAGLYYAGLQSCPTVTFNKNGVNYGFCAFAPNNGTVSILDLENASRTVKELKKTCQIVIVSFHGGGEGPGFRHLTNGEENYLGENRGNPQIFAKTVIDAGADIVFGHGPHVPRAIDIYKNKFIAYSLGNFATYARFNLKSYAGFAPLVQVEINQNGDFLRGKIISFVQEGEGGPVLDQNHRAALDIKQLTESDLPNSSIEISEQGIISRKN
jgi:poly-gamma-glutamate capsule biosynthesis protein CapA/YwtB (metallophosphatase superfamily)